MKICTFKSNIPELAVVLNSVQKLLGKNNLSDKKCSLISNSAYFWCTLAWQMNVRCFQCNNRNNNYNSNKIIIMLGKAGVVNEHTSMLKANCSLWGTNVWLPTALGMCAHFSLVQILTCVHCLDGLIVEPNFPSMIYNR